MPVNTVISPEQNLIIHTITDSMDLPLLIDTISLTLKNPNYKVGMNAVWHFHHVAEINLSSNDLIFVADFASKNIDKDGKPYQLALVAADDLPYGLSRVYEAWSSERPVTIKNFRALDEAMKWINTRQH